MTYSEKKRITKRNVDATKATDKDYVLWDDQISGFGLRVKPSGTKSYFVQYRNSKGTSRRYTLGKHGHLTPEQARDMAMREMGRIASDAADPAEEKLSKLKEHTIKELCDLYLEDGCKSKAKSTIYTDKGRIEHHIKPLLGRKKITEVKRADVTKMMHDIADGKTSADQKTGKHGRAIVRGGNLINSGFYWIIS